MPFKFLRFRLPAICRTYFVAGVCAAFACLLSSGAVAAPGQLDPTFGVGGKVILSPPSNAAAAAVVVSLHDGRYILGGSDGDFFHFFKARFASDGARDLTYLGAGQPPVSLFAIGQVGALAPDEKFLLAGICVSPSRACVSRYLDSGALDPFFAGTGSVVSSIGIQAASAVIVDALNRTLIAGDCTTSTTSNSGCIVRYLADGSLDLTFGNGGKVSGTQGASIAIQNDQKIVLAGACFNGTDYDICVTRHLPNGALDVEFGNAGTTVVDRPGFDDRAFALGIAEDGGLLAAGRCSNETDADFCLIRLKPNGLIDTAFGVSGRAMTAVGSGNDEARGLSLQSDGKIVLSGRCASGSRNLFCAARYNADGSLDGSFSGAGKAIVDMVAFSSVGTGQTIDRYGNIVIAGLCNNATGTDFCLARLEGGPYSSAACALDVDANLATRVHSDALLLTRYLLGLRGDALTTGALGLNPTRTGQALETYLASLDLDVDGDGQTLATTDGLLLIRALLGLTGDALTAGATNATHPNVRNAQQILSWIESTHGVACLP